MIDAAARPATPRNATAAWAATLATVTVIGTLATACMMPSVALAVAAAATMRRSHAVATVALIWATNQALGFALLGYPPTAYAIAWGLALGVAGIGAMFVASRLVDRHRLSAAAVALAFAAAFAAYEIGLFGFALLAGGTATFTPAIVLRILTNDAGWFVALVALHAVLTRVAPRAFGHAPALRLA